MLNAQGSLLKPGYLLLEDGSLFTGFAFGETGSLVFGELVFNTGMTGYQDILTDPSYAGQSVVLTYPLIGNYGINPEDVQSAKIQASALIISECESPSNWKSLEAIDVYLKKEGVFGLSGVDTRLLTRTIRSKGNLTCLLTSQPINDDNIEHYLDQLRTWQMPVDYVYRVSTKTIQTLKPHTAHPVATVGVVDLGTKNGILNELLKRNVEIRLFPANTSVEELLSAKLDAILFSNGPGDPKDLPEIVQTVKEVIGKLPVFGICLGHQVIAQALGARTYKLPFGHRGSNHPVLNARTNQVMITAQNHGYSVVPETLPSHIERTYLHLHDNTVAGLSDHSQRVYSVQFHPEAGPGPTEGSAIFDEWLSILEKSANQNADKVA